MNGEIDRCHCLCSFNGLSEKGAAHGSQALRTSLVRISSSVFRVSSFEFRVRGNSFSNQVLAKWANDIKLRKWSQSHFEYFVSEGNANRVWSFQRKGPCISLHHRKAKV